MTDRGTTFTLVDVWLSREKLRNRLTRTGAGTGTDSSVRIYTLFCMCQRGRSHTKSALARMRMHAAHATQICHIRLCFVCACGRMHVICITFERDCRIRYSSIVVNEADI